MKKSTNNINLPLWILACTICIAIASCKKGWLDEKPRKSLVVPTTIEDMQAILDNAELINGTVTGATAGIGEASADNYYLTYSDWQGRPEIERNAYVWATQIYENNTSTDWNRPYRSIYYANSVLDAMPRLRASNNDVARLDNLEGTALFYRAFFFHNLASVFCDIYSGNPASPGIPLKLTSDLNEKIFRSTLAETYEQIINDLQKAAQLLPETAPYKTRPTKAAANAMLSRVYLSMNDYDQALVYANAALSKYNKLIDYNSLTLTATFPIQRFNDETIFHSVMNSSALWSTRHKVDETLYASYQTNDLRRTGFFKVNTDGSKMFKGSYNGSALLFSGIATDELLLTRAECLARKGDIINSLADLNALLVKRFKTGTFVAITASTATDALAKILTERRKELIFRGIRWPDLKRLNAEPSTSTTITRNLNGTIYSLPPLSKKYVLPIPDDVIAANPGMPQNQR